jgi:hypothetical protein
MFADVPSNGFAASWIEQLAREGITVGCDSKSFCPNINVPRNQMAAFIVRTFHL